MVKKTKKALPRYASAMKGEELWSKIQKAGFASQVAFAAAIGVSDRTVRGWISGLYPVPLIVAILVNLMIDTKSNPEDLNA
ncbi:MAG: hypothetical protein J2P55_01175 [Rhizobiales bacterium]|nr:hypothetical protein [Hyphomicrobiales bacterium]